jgi:hypothetical protein
MITEKSLQGNQIAIYEKLGNEYPFFVELKLPASFDPTHLSTSLHAILSKFVDESDVECLRNVYIATSEESNGIIDTRMLWKDFMVTTHEALTMRERIVGELSARDHEEENNEYFRWHEIVDYDCYTSGDGLVLPGSTSYTSCKTCNGKRSLQAECTECWGRGICQNSHVYLPKAHVIYDGDNCEVKKLTRANHTFLPEHISVFSLMTSDSPKVPFKRPFGTPFYHMEQKAKSPPVVYPSALSGYYNGMCKKKTLQSGVPLPEALLLRKAIQTAFKRYHGKVDVKPELIIHDAKHKCYIVPVFGIGSNTCIKYSGEHEDSRVYFIVRPSGIEQCCHSKDRIKSVSGECECKTKKCAPVPMNSTMKGCLFPSETHKTSTKSSISSSSTYQLVCRASDICWENINAKKRKTSIFDFI